MSDLGLSGVAAYMYKPILHIEIAQWINDCFLPINGSFFSSDKQVKYLGQMLDH